MIVGEAPGENEVREKVPFVGMSGDELTRMLKEAGIDRSQCFITNVCRVRPPENDITAFIAQSKKAVTNQHVPCRDKMVLPYITAGVDLLKQEIALCRPNVIIALGNLALWALTGNWGITSWRGSELLADLELPGLDYKPKVLPAYHPAAILRQYSWRPVAVHDFRRAAKMAETREFIPRDYDFIIRPDFPTVMRTLEVLQKIVEKTPLKLSVDLETRSRHTACCGIAWSRREAICIPFMCVENSEGYWNLEEETAIVLTLNKLLTHPNARVVGQNFSYDAQYTDRHWHFVPNLARDTMLAQHCLFSNLPKGLDYLSSMYCEQHVYWKDESKEWDPAVGEEQLWTYNCKDAVITYEVDDSQQPFIDQFGVRAVHEFQQALFWPVLKSMNRGLRVDEKRRGQFAMLVQDEIAKREQWMIDVLGFPVNIKSPVQMQDLFYNVLRQKPIFNRKTKTLTVNDEALTKISERELLLKPLCDKIAELRTLGVFMSTFIAAPSDIDGRMRCSFNIGGTETYRFSSSQNAFGSGMNLQNVPKGGDDGDGLELPNIRELFIPDPGMTFFDIDLSSADLRIVTWEADEPEMKAMLREGLDPYTEIAKEFYKDQSITKKDPRRQTFKSFAHGTHYLGTPKGLAEKLGLSVADATSTQEWYFQRFPRIKKWQDDLKDQVLKRHMVSNIFGYRQYFFDRIDGTIFNQAAAWIPQSTVACLINRAYVNIDRDLPQVEILLQVHDSLAGQFPTHLGNWMVNKIVECAQIVLPYDDPLIIPVGVKTSTKSWGDCG